MTNNEKILGITTVVLIILLYRKSKEKQVCPSCNCTSLPPAVSPQVIISPIVNEVKPLPKEVTDPKLLESAMVYNGPSKFTSPLNATKGFVYSTSSGKFFKTEFDNSLITNNFPTIEITKSEMISAWNLVKPN